MCIQAFHHISLQHILFGSADLGSVVTIRICPFGLSIILCVAIKYTLDMHKLKLISIIVTLKRFHQIFVPSSELLTAIVLLLKVI